ncbi:MAG TPA: NPCBM/NEW2 domain-containing protein, partial [Gemmata sp.]|nr:NPCBM/NEW2 domain-containing protein [Gemmata sp.]
DVFGNSLIAQSLDIGKNGVTVTTVSGVVVKYASQSAIAKLDYAQGNIAFLSDLDPLVDAPDQSMDEKKFRLNVATAFTKDQNVANEPLKLGSESYSKGISIAPDTRLTFNIGGDFREFKAVIGMQENSPDANLEAKVTIETEEGRVLFSEVLKRKDKPRAVGLDVKGVKQLLVSVDANLPVNGNRVIMADARLQK